MSIITQRLARAEQALPKPPDDPVSPLMREATRIMMYMRPDYTNDGPPAQTLKSLSYISGCTEIGRNGLTA